MLLAEVRTVPKLVGLSTVALIAFAAACSSPSKEPDLPPVDSELSVAIGIPAGPDELDFAPLEPGSEMRLQSFGQGGTHLLLGVRCVGFGNRAFVTVVLENSRTGASVTSPPPAQGQLLYCHDDVGCDLVPLLAMASGLARADEEREGLPVNIQVEARAKSGATANANVDVVLSTADL